jgi:phosphorylcholine metabolism protein LicD
MFGNVAYAYAYTEAYFPYNPQTGAFGFGRFLANQTLDSFTKYLNRKEKIKVYITDLSHVTERYGLMIWISDPDATITVMRLDERERTTYVNMEVLEVTPNYKIVDVMDPTLEKIVIIVTSPNKNSRFSINIIAICE